MNNEIQRQGRWHLVFYGIFFVSSVFIMIYYLSDTLVHFTTSRQFPINSFARLPLTWLIFPAEMFSFLFGLYFVYTLFRDRDRERPAGRSGRPPAVAVLVPVYNEPAEVVARTLEACAGLSWKGSATVYLLDDSDDPASMKEMDAVARKHRATVVRRGDRDGYKAGNINNAVSTVVEEPYFVILDADQAPEPEFLEEMMPYFTGEDVAFVQAPQHFINEDSVLERTAKTGNNVFFHAMCTARSRDRSMIFCGTNAVIRTSAFLDVGGFAYYSATEDLEIGLRLNEHGYHGKYVPKVLVKGYSPRTFGAYATQQYRWANGNLAVLRQTWLKVLSGNFTFRQQVHTFFVLGWWLIGFVTLAYVLVPILSLTLGIGTHHTWLPHSVIAWLYFHVALGIGMIYVSLRDRLGSLSPTDAFLQYSLLTNSMFIYVRASLNALFGRFAGFVRTDKRAGRSGLQHIRWNLLLAAVCFVVSAYALFEAARASDVIHLRTYLPVSLWLLFYCIVLSSSILFVGEAPA